MGSGKTTKMLGMINNDKFSDNRYMFITPFLTEISRIKQATDNRFYEPKNEIRKKYADVMSLLHRQKDIIATHALFMDFKDTIEQLIVSGDYILILDEVTTPIKLYKISKYDMKLLLNNEHISVDEDGFLIWNPTHMDYDGDFNWVKRFALKHCLMVYGDLNDDENCKLVVWTYPIEIFKAFKKVYILTYKFNGCLLKPYFQINDIQYEHCTLDINDRVVAYSEKLDYLRRKDFSKLINICENRKLNYIGFNETALSKNWFESQKGLPAKESKTTILKKNMNNYFRNILKASSDEILWTTFKDYKEGIKGKGYAQGFLECNSRATNDYIQKSKLAYCLNRYENPLIKNYFSKKGILLNQDELAIGEMLQWIWRSQIREKKPIDIYIPSSRMRNLLHNWLDCKGGQQDAI